MEESASILARRRKRLSDEHVGKPWIKAKDLGQHCLYWLPVSGFPLRHDEKEWVTEFLVRFDIEIKEHHDLRAETFYQWKQLAKDGHNTFNKYAASFMALMGISRKPGEGIPAFPSNDTLRGILKSGEDFKIGDWTADYCYWFVLKKTSQQRQLFMGTGGMVTLYLCPDPKTKPPKIPMTPRLRAVFAKDTDQVTIDELIEGTFAMKDGFLAKSKKVFGLGLEDEAQYRGIPFIVPLLSSSHFFAATPEDRATWFDVFPVYLNESVMDKGLIMAFQEEYETVFLDVIETLDRDELFYPGYGRER